MLSGVLECLANDINWQPAEVRTQLVVVRFFGCDLPLLIALKDLKQETF
jgi:phage shock protein PspC (stress-responsive transcriptional regulator)